MKSLCSLFIAVFLIFCSAQDVSSLETDYKKDNTELESSLGLSDLYNDLPPQVKKVLSDLGIKGIDAESILEVEFTDVFTNITSVTSDEIKPAFVSLGIVMSVLFLYSLSEGFFQSITSESMNEVLSVVSALCIACALVIPVTKVMDAANEAVKTAAAFMLSFVPVMVTVLVSCGKMLSGSGYYSLMILAAEGIAQLSSKVIIPLLNVFLGVGICTSVVPQIKMDGITDLFAKTIKWMLSFSFTIFSALLTFRTLISTAMDSVSTRAVRFTLSSFIPVVGAALSEAYKTVQGSINVLKNGIGVFVIFAVAIVFLPIVIKLVVWSFTVSLCKTFSQMLNQTVPARILGSVSTVLSVLLATILCVMALFIISTALIITVGGHNT